MSQGFKSAGRAWRGGPGRLLPALVFNQIAQSDPGANLHLPTIHTSMEAKSLPKVKVRGGLAAEGVGVRGGPPLRGARSAEPPENY